MVDERTGRHRRYAAAPLVVLLLVAAGCGGKSADQKANEAYANSVCGAIGSWETQVKSIATGLSSGISQASLQTAVTKAEAATTSLTKEIKAVPPPNTSQGQATKQQLDQLSTALATTAASAKTTAAGLPANATTTALAAAALGLAPQVKSLATTAQTTISTLKSSKQALSSAFKSADSCKSLGSSG